jgi:hypothetical protein
VGTLEGRAPKGLKWAFVDRSSSEEHRTMALISWLDAMRIMFLTPSRSGTPLPLIYEGGKVPAYTPAVRNNLDAGSCRRAIAQPLTFEEKNKRAKELFGMCLLMKPGPKITSGNMTTADFGVADEEDQQISGGLGVHPRPTFRHCGHRGRTSEFDKLRAFERSAIGFPNLCPPHRATQSALSRVRTA